MASRALALCMRSVARASARLNHGNMLARSACAPLTTNQRALSAVSRGQRTRWTDLLRVRVQQAGDVCVWPTGAGLFSDLPVSC